MTYGGGSRTFSLRSGGRARRVTIDRISALLALVLALASEEGELHAVGVAVTGSRLASGLRVRRSVDRRKKDFQRFRR